ncbi:hypothetical protein [Streptomyces sp. NPDC048277]|uniref:hypothetical protein n=1 Tax=Streptomyces sp. NPDC048277 TaxID=3155027 RepID=UPI0033E6CF52
MTITIADPQTLTVPLIATTLGARDIYATSMRPERMASPLDEPVGDDVHPAALGP